MSGLASQVWGPVWMGPVMIWRRLLFGEMGVIELAWRLGNAATVSRTNLTMGEVSKTQTRQPIWISQRCLTWVLQVGIEALASSPLAVKPSGNAVRGAADDSRKSLGVAAMGDVCFNPRVHRKFHRC